eukprot:scaffold56458_cov24-Phaeocystis_antarctica.AAC.1
MALFEMCRMSTEHIVTDHPVRSYSAETDPEPTLPSAGRQVRLRRARFDSQGCHAFVLRPRVEGAG